MRNFIRVIILIIFFLVSRFGFTQDLVPYHDSASNFSIGVPKGWTYQVINNANSSIKLIVYRSKETEPDNPRETFNVNVLPFSNSDIENVYKSMLESISQRLGYHLVTEGDTIIESKKYKWLIEKHTNANTNETMSALIYLGYKDGKAYMTTFATTEHGFERYLMLFRKISSTFRL